MAKITLNNAQTVEEAFEDFIFYKNTQGVTEKTIIYYKSTFQCISKYLVTTINISDLTKKDLQKMIAKMRASNLATNTITCYVRALRVFLSWAKNEGLCNVTIQSYKTEETVKETYSDAELSLLLKKPNLKSCRFTEYRSWVIINFLVNSGARASTIRNILIGDIDLENGFVTYRHNKNHRVQVIPLCSQMIVVLKEYLYYRKGAETDYLFCTEDGQMLSENALLLSIELTI